MCHGIVAIQILNTQQEITEMCVLLFLLSQTPHDSTTSNDRKCVCYSPLC